MRDRDLCLSMRDMIAIARGLLRGAVAGAAGVTALNLATYLDMLLRARPASEAPQQLVEQLALDAGITISGDPDERKNRVQALGPLSGLVSGMTVGMAAGVLREAGIRPPGWVAAPALGAAAMAAADVPLAATRISDPREWAVADWLADVIPHAVFGTVVHATLAQLDQTRG